MAVIREDVVQIGFEVQQNPFSQLTAQMEELRQSVTNAVNGSNDELARLGQNANSASDGLGNLANAAQEVSATNTSDLTESVESVATSANTAADGLTEVAQEARTAATSVQGLANAAQQVNAAGTGGLTSSMHATQAAAQSTTRTFTQMLRDLRTIARTRVENSLNALRSIPTQAATRFRSLRTTIQSLRNINLRSIGRSLDAGLGRAITGCINGARRLGSALRTAARVSFHAAISGLKKMATYALKTASALGTGLVKGAKMAAKALAVSTVAVGALVTASVKSYADYEQLVGGVETLFGAGGQSIEEYAKSVGKSVADVSKDYQKLMSSQDAVFKNANEAYKTAGLSANDYMETVTSFSASLISSLGGDTEKAAKYADMAIVDMSDNANKMGSDMESIQNAYQGFAKQNYTMLDNLKLGYGGTKEEMARLLKDATKLSGVKYDLSSYADIVDAIHVIQENMGITGTTAKEAEQTISGSLASMKAAWSNMLVALVQGGDDFDRCIDNLVSSVSTFFGNIMPVIKSALSGIARLIDELAPMIADALPDLVSSTLPALLNAAMAIVQGLISALPNILSSITAVLPSIIDGLLDGVVTLVDSIIDVLMQCAPDIISALITSLSKAVTSLISMIPQFVEVAAELVTALADGITEQLPTLVTTLVQGIGDYLNSLVAAIPKLIEAGAELLLGLVQGIINALPTLLSYAPTIIQNLVTAITQALPLLINAAIQLVQMLLTGILQNLPLLVQSALQMVEALLQGIIQNLPVIINGALSLIEAIVQGLIQNLPMLVQAAIQLVNGIATGLLQQLPLIITLAIQLIMTLVQGLISQIPLLIQAAIELVISLVSGLLANLGLLVEAALQLIIALAGGLIEAIPQLIAAIPQIVGAIIDGLMSVDWVQVGKDLIGGVWDGVKSLFSDGDDKGKQAASSVASGITSNSYTATTAASSLATSTSNSMQLNTMQISGYGASATTSLASGITANTATATTAARNMANSTAISMQDLTSTTSQLGANTATNLASGITANTATATAAASNMSNQVSSAANTDVEVNIKANTESLTAFKEQVKEMVESAQTALKKMPEIFEDAMTSSTAAVTAGMAKMLVAFTNGFKSTTTLTTNTMASVKMTIACTDLYSSGVNMMRGLITGMNNMRPQVLAVARSIAKQAANTINKELKIHSPSRVTTESGEFTAQGLAVGMQNMKDTVAASAQNISFTAANSIKPELSAYTPSNSAMTTNTSTSNNTYSPHFTLNLNGASATDSNKRKIQKWVKESIQEAFESMGRIDPELCEV